MGNTIKVFFKESSEIVKDSLIWAEEISKVYKPDLVIFLAKSGFLYGKPMAEKFGCAMADIVISRSCNKKMDIIKKIIPNVPKPLLAMYLRKKVSKKGYEIEKERIISKSERFNSLQINSFSKILIVDDSVDTGWSILKALDYIKEAGYKGEYKIASYCVLSQAFERVNVDFYRFIDSIVITATSRYSREYKEFIKEYEDWMMKMRLDEA